MLTMKKIIFFLIVFFNVNNIANADAITDMSAFNGGGLFNNAGKGFNPIMLMALADKSSSDFMTITLMSQLMGGGNMFGNMFGAANKSATETPEPSELDKINAKVDTLTDNVNALVSALANNIKTQTKEEA